MHLKSAQRSDPVDLFFNPMQESVLQQGICIQVFRNIG
jgi:hypothetical protein